MVILLVTFEQQVSRKGVYPIHLNSPGMPQPQYYCRHLEGPSVHEAVEVEG